MTSGVSGTPSRSKALPLLVLSVFSVVAVAALATFSIYAVCLYQRVTRGEYNIKQLPLDITLVAACSALLLLLTAVIVTMGLDLARSRALPDTGQNTNGPTPTEEDDRKEEEREEEEERKRQEEEAGHSQVVDEKAKGPTRLEDASVKSGGSRQKRHN